MIPLLSSNVLVVSFPWRNLAFSSSPTHFTLRFDFSPISQTKLFSSVDVPKEVDKGDPFTASYLINSCGFSPENAKSVSRRVQIKDPSNLDSILDYLKNHGFSNAHIQKISITYPPFLTMNLEKTVKPKIEFFISIGVKGDDLLAIMCADPSLLASSLDKKIGPCYNFLKWVLGHDELVVKSLKLNSRFLKGNLEKNVVPNFELLKTVGVPESNIKVFVIRASRLLALNNAKFSERVNKVIDMGFDTSKYSFLEAVWISQTSYWERKTQVLRSWGWSDSDMSSAFRKNPKFMITSVEKLTAVMDFSVNKLGWDPSVVAAAHRLFNRSLKKCVIPKCSVLRVLQLKGLIGEEIPMNSIVEYTENQFFDRYLFKYLEQVPELLDIYKGEVDLSELGFGFEEKLETKLELLHSS